MRVCRADPRPSFQQARKAQRSRGSGNSLLGACRELGKNDFDPQKCVSLWQATVRNLSFTSVARQSAFLGVFGSSLPSPGELPEGERASWLGVGWGVGGDCWAGALMGDRGL